MYLLRHWRAITIGALVLLAILYCTVSAFLANGVTKASRSEFSNHPIEYNLPFEDVAFSPRGDTLTLSGWYFTEPDKEHTIIVVHGLGSNRAGGPGLGLAAQLWDNGFNLLLFDLRGHGISDSGRMSGGYFEQNDVLGAFDFVRNDGVPADQIGVMGYSLGAATSILAAAREPAIHALVAEAPYANVSDLIIQELARTTSLPDWLLPFFEIGSTLAADLLYGIKIGEMIPEIAVAEIQYPILLIHGIEDTRIPLEHSIRIHEGAHPGSDLWQVSNVGHIAAFQDNPEEYTKRVVDYFEGRLGNTK